MENTKLHQQENCENYLSLLLDYSKYVKKNYTNPQNILKEDLKKDFHSIQKNCQEFHSNSCENHSNSGVNQNLEQSQTFSLKQSKENNEFLDKYIFSNIPNISIDNVNTNMVLLNQDEYLRLKAGGCEQSKQIANNYQCVCAHPSYEKEKNVQFANDDISEIQRQDCFSDTLTESGYNHEYNKISSTVYIPIPQIKKTESKCNSKNKKLSFAENIEEIKPLSDETLKDEDSINTKKSSVKPKLTVLEFDKIMTQQLKKREQPKSSRNNMYFFVPNDECKEGTTTIKSSVINAAVNGIPLNYHFSEDFELMEAIDRFIQAETACNFQKALRAAETAAKHAPPGFEEEAAVEAARNVQNQKENITSNDLNKKKKPIEIIAYVGSTGNKK